MGLISLNSLNIKDGISTVRNTARSLKGKVTEQLLNDSRVRQEKLTEAMSVVTAQQKPATTPVTEEDIFGSGKSDFSDIDLVDDWSKIQQWKVKMVMDNLLNYSVSRTIKDTSKKSQASTDSLSSPEAAKIFIDQLKSSGTPVTMENYGNLWTYLSTYSQEYIFKDIQGSTKYKYTRCFPLGQYMFKPKYSYSGVNAGFTNMRQVYNLYEELLHRLKSQTNITFNTDLLKNIDDLLFEGVIDPGLFSNDRCFNKTTFINIPKTTTGIFSDNRDDLILSILNNRKNFLSDTELNQFLSLYAAKIVEIIEANRESYQDGIDDELKEAEAELLGSITKTAIDFNANDISNLYGITDYMAGIYQATKEVIKIRYNMFEQYVNDGVDHEFEFYENMEKGYCFIEAFDAITEKLKDIKFTSIFNVKIYQFFYLLSKYLGRNQEAYSENKILEFYTDSNNFLTKYLAFRDIVIDSNKFDVPVIHVER